MTCFKLSALFVALSAIASAGTTTPVIYVADDTHQLLSYDIDSNTFTPVGSPMQTLIGGMGCVDPTLLYGTDVQLPVGLYAIDTSSGEATALGQAPGHSAVGCTVGPDGNVWAISTTADGLLYEIDPATVIATDVGSTGFANEGQPGFDTSGNLFTFRVSSGSDILYQLDPNTAGGTPIGPVGYSVYAAAFCGDTFYAFSGGATRIILTVDTATGQGTVVAGYGPPVTGSIQAAACCLQ